MIDLRKSDKGSALDGIDTTIYFFMLLGDFPSHLQPNRYLKLVYVLFVRIS